MRCKPTRQFIFAYNTKQPTSCFVSFDVRQVWKYSDIGDNLVEVWRDNVSVRMEKERFERCFKIDKVTRSEIRQNGLKRLHLG